MTKPLDELAIQYGVCRHVRALFLSDLHLGTRSAKAEELLDFLKQWEADVIYLVGDIELNRTAMSVLRRGNTIALGPTDYRLLEFLMQSPGRVFSRVQLLDGVWGTDVYVDERTVDVHIGRLRKALLKGWSDDPIRTVRGAGYCFEGA